MGNHKFFVPNMAHRNRVSKKLVKNKGSSKYDDSRNQKINKESFLEMKFKSLMEKYKNDHAIRETLLGELQIYRLNLTLAREFNDKDTEKQLRRNFIQFLNQF